MRTSIHSIKMSEETTEERQNNELIALQSIFTDAVKDVRQKSVWNEWRPLDILLTLVPLHHSEGVHCSITLQFKCCHNYPDKPPEISIYKKSGISDENGTKLLQDLIKLTTDLCGEVMIYELAQHTQQFLHEHNKPTLSLYEQMQKDKNEMEKLKQHDLLVRENEERQKMKDEIQRRQEALKGVRQRSTSNSMNDDSAEALGDGLIFYADDILTTVKKISRSCSATCTCNMKTLKVIKHAHRNNKKVYIGNCIGHSPNGATTYLAVDDDGERVIVKKWLITSASDFQTQYRQISSIQQDLRSMQRLKNQSLTPYTELILESRHAKQQIYIFRDFVLGSSLKFFQDDCFVDRFDVLKLLRYVALGVFSALNELHSAGVLHRDVRSENVFLCGNGAVKLVGASLDVRITEMLAGDSYCDQQTEAQDIYAAALLLQSIVTRGVGQEIPSGLPSSAKDFFSRCFTEDLQVQWSAEQLMNHDFLVDKLGQPLGDKENVEEDSSSESDDGSRRINNIGTIAKDHSRLHEDFEVLAWLGKGAFGDVVKVKKKLDGRFYAIKHIQLNPRSVEMNKKITREVKLLSRLNHENVVRYYNAWIETEELDSESEGSSVQKLGPKVKVTSTTLSTSEGPVKHQDEYSDSDDNSDEEDNLCPPEDELSSIVEFAVDSQRSMTPEDTPISTGMRPSLRQTQVLYIQMEFCEKNTLRQAIDSGLYQEHVRAWRLFREILEGLSHVHQKGMIHRDLKPVNIFLDSNDHVKIGDFGLATKVFTELQVDDKTKSEEDPDGLLTGKIGTALYVAPELQQSATKVMYNQKVDIYSLGIILFEMFHAPFTTGTERCVVLTNLRKKEVVVPEDFQRVENAKQIHVLRWLLNHDASVRPTSADLLASEHVPRAVPQNTLSGLVSHTLRERGSRGYQRLVEACLDQKLTAAEDFTYHSGMKSKPMDVVGVLKDVIVKVFQSHGASEFSPPLLIPRAGRWDQYPYAVKVMTASGSVCHLPHDLRLPFARHIAYTGTKYMRRYVVERVYRETARSVKGFHPREMIECAFDIVTPKTDTLWPDAELLVVACRAAAACALKVSFQLNHTELLTSLLLSCGVPLDKHAAIYPVLVDASLARMTKLQLQTHLTTFGMSFGDISNIVRLMEADVGICGIRELVSRVRREKWSRQLEMALRDLEAVCGNAEALGCDCPITIAPCLAYNATQHNGVFWQMSVIRNTDQKSMKHRSKDLLAAGGRYDVLVGEFWKVALKEKDRDSELKSVSVGFSMSLERMAAIFKDLELEVPAAPSYVPGLVCVYVSGSAGSSREGVATRGAHLARELWAGGYCAATWPVAAAVARETCRADARETCRATVVMKQHDAYVHVDCWECERVREHKVPFKGAVDFVKLKLNPDVARNPDYNNRSVNWCETDKSNSPTTSITFITQSHHERMTKNVKRSHEAQINSQITSTLMTLGLQPVLGRVKVNVVAVACDSACVRTLAANLTAPLHAQNLEQAFSRVADTFFKHQDILKEALRELKAIVKQCNQNRSLDKEPETQLFALYSIPDSLCRLIT